MIIQYEHEAIMEGRKREIAPRKKPTLTPQTQENTDSPATPTMERHIVISDLHYREYFERVYDAHTGAYVDRKALAHDPRALAVVEAFMRDWKPTHIWLNGDMLDMPQLSRFDKEQYDSEGLEQDLLGVKAIMHRIRRHHPDAEMHYLLGNHEERISRYLRANAPALRWLTSLTYERIFDSESIRMNIYPYCQRVAILPGVFEVVHGDKVAQKSGYTAHRMLEQGISGVSGHVHRLAAVYKTTRSGMLMWIEGGCLCDLNPSYVADPNWQQGYSVLYVDRPNARYHADIIPVINGRVVYAGKVYEAP